MIKLPRDVSCLQRASRAQRLGYSKLRQHGSHLMVRTEVGGKHDLHIPLHSPLKPGTLSTLLKLIAEHHRLTLQQVIELLDL